MPCGLGQGSYCLGDVLGFPQLVPSWKWGQTLGNSNAGRVLAARGWLPQVAGQSSTRIHGLDILSVCTTR